MSDFIARLGIEIATQGSDGVRRDLAGVEQQANKTAEAAERAKQALSTMGRTSGSFGGLTSELQAAERAIGSFQQKASASLGKSLSGSVRGFGGNLAAETTREMQLAMRQTVEAGVREFETTFRQRFRPERLRDISRAFEKASADSAQGAFNQLMGVGRRPANSARASAQVFEEAFGLADAAAKRAADSAQSAINQFLGVDRAIANSAKASASVFQDRFRVQDALAKASAKTAADAAKLKEAADKAVAASAKRLAAEQAAAFRMIDRGMAQHARGIARESAAAQRAIDGIGRVGGGDPLGPLSGSFAGLASHIRGATSTLSLFRAGIIGLTGGVLVDAIRQMAVEADKLAAIEDRLARTIGNRARAAEVAARARQSAAGTGTPADTFAEPMAEAVANRRQLRLSPVDTAGDAQRLTEVLVRSAQAAGATAEQARKAVAEFVAELAKAGRITSEIFNKLPIGTQEAIAKAFGSTVENFRQRLDANMGPLAGELTARTRFTWERLLEGIAKDAAPKNVAQIEEELGRAWREVQRAVIGSFGGNASDYKAALENITGELRRIEGDIRANGLGEALDQVARRILASGESEFGKAFGDAARHVEDGLNSTVRAFVDAGTRVGGSLDAVESALNDGATGIDRSIVSLADTIRSGGSLVSDAFQAVGGAISSAISGIAGAASRMMSAGPPAPGSTMDGFMPPSSGGFGVSAQPSGGTASIPWPGSWTGGGTSAGSAGGTSGGSGGSTTTYNDVWGLNGGAPVNDIWGLGYATGGPVHGPGGPTEDRVPAMLSAGEFVINAEAVSKHRGLLEAINAGDIRRYASGGYVPAIYGGATSTPGIYGGGALADIAPAALNDASRSIAASAEQLQKATADIGKNVAEAVLRAVDSTISDLERKREGLIEDQERKVSDYLAAGPSPYERNPDLFYDPAARRSYAAGMFSPETEQIERLDDQISELERVRDAQEALLAPTEAELAEVRKLLPGIDSIMQRLGQDQRRALMDAMQSIAQSSLAAQQSYMEAVNATAAPATGASGISYGGSSGGTSGGTSGGSTGIIPASGYLGGGVLRGSSATGTIPFSGYGGGGVLRGSVTGTTLPWSGYGGGGVLRTFASGGPVIGPGTGTSDDIPARLSNGEYVVRAEAASRHIGLLERINSGLGAFDGDTGIAELDRLLGKRDRAKPRLGIGATVRDMARDLGEDAQPGIGAIVSDLAQAQDQTRGLGSIVRDMVRGEGSETLASLGEAVRGLLPDLEDIGSAVPRRVLDSLLVDDTRAPALDHLPTFATGGMIRGPGTGTSDSITALVSNGEFVVNAAATSRHLDLLKAINAGGLPRFAEGGQVSFDEYSQRLPRSERVAVMPDRASENAKAVTNHVVQGNTNIGNLIVQVQGGGGRPGETLKKSYGDMSRETRRLARHSLGR